MPPGCPPGGSCVGGEVTAAVHFSPAFCPMATAKAFKIRQNLPSLGPLSPSALAAAQNPGAAPPTQPEVHATSGPSPGERMGFRRGFMMGRRWLFAGWIVSAGLVLATSPLVAVAQASPEAPAAAQSSSDQGVTVKVTLKSIGSPDSRWEFTVALDTHSADLNDDLTLTATLRTDDGRTLKPVSWVGAAPGGHHREGVLAFDVPAPRPSAIELRIVRPGESAPRTFRWQL